MASREGRYVQGTDGTDFSHRERVASHYKQSVVWKGKIKYSLIPHLFLAFLGVVWTVVAVSGFRQDISKPAPWQFIWLLSSLSTIFGLLSLPKNNTTLISMYVIGSVLLGVIPVGYGSSVAIFKIVENYTVGKSPFGLTWQDSPYQLAILTLILQIHMFGLFYGYKLRGAWMAKGEVKKSS